MIDIVVPELGAARHDTVRVSCWFVDVGDEVIEGDRLVELLISEATFDVACPATGTLARIVLGAESLARAGAVLGQIDDGNHR
jgi:pyruvate/2-oxoglutarate dehydrogenase complex dihydrolipoamide acyltransferase (E2) component